MSTRCSAAPGISMATEEFCRVHWIGTAVSRRRVPRLRRRHVAGTGGDRHAVLHRHRSRPHPPPDRRGLRQRSDRLRRQPQRRCRSAAPRRDRAPRRPRSATSTRSAVSVTPRQHPDQQHRLDAGEQRQVERRGSASGRARTAARPGTRRDCASPARSSARPTSGAASATLRPSAPREEVQQDRQSSAAPASRRQRCRLSMPARIAKPRQHFRRPHHLLHQHHREGADRDRGQVDQPHDDGVDAGQLGAADRQHQQLVELHLQVEQHFGAGDVERIGQPPPSRASGLQAQPLARIENSRRRWRATGALAAR